MIGWQRPAAAVRCALQRLRLLRVRRLRKEDVFKANDEVAKGQAALQRPRPYQMGRFNKQSRKAALYFIIYWATIS